jgi:hypothetical protein
MCAGCMVTPHLHSSHSQGAFHLQPAPVHHASTQFLALRPTSRAIVATRTLHHIVVFVAMADFDLFAGDFQFTDFNNFAPPLLDSSMSIAHPQPNHYPLAPSYGSPASSISPLAQGYDQASKKRKLDSANLATQQSLDENARIAAEEDKRRRNTAASARFRVKKKERERALEQSQKEAAEKVAKLEATIQQLQTENAWLKGLITEKNGGKSSTEELKALISRREQAASERSSSTRTDGVGTKAQSPKADA